MLARLLKINPNRVIIQDENGDIYDVSKTELAFRYKLGDKIEMIQNGKDYYFLPLEQDKYPNIWQDPKTRPKTFSLQSKSIANSSKGVAGWLLLYIFMHISSAIVILLFTVIIGFSGNALPTTSDIPYEYQKGLSIFLITGIILFIIMYGTQLIAAVLLLSTKKHKAVTFNIITLIVKWVLLAISLKNQSEVITPLVFLGMIDSIIWIIYLATSKRVRNTYTD